MALRPLLSLVIAVVLAGCQTTGQNSWLSSTTTTSATPATASDAGGVSPDVASEASFEIGRNPYSYGDIPPGAKPLPDTVEAGIWYSLDRIEEKAKTGGNRIYDAQLNDYVGDIVCRLAGPYCDDVRVYVMRIPAFNATMAPNGMMSVYSGLLLRTQNEAQLATVLGHEIGHYIRRHSAQRLEDAVAKTDAALVVGIAAASMGIPAVGDLAQLVAIGSIQSYSRDNEREADLVGIHLLAKHGYDTREAAKVWAQLIQELDPDLETRGSTSFLSTHPSSKEREETLTSLALKIQGEGKWGKTHKDRFQQTLGSWKTTFLRDEIATARWDSTLRLLDILAEAGHPGAEVAFFKGEVYRRRGRDADENEEQDEERIADIDRALEQFKAAASMSSPLPETYRSLGLVYQRKRMYGDARTAFEKFLVLKPEAKDAQMIRFMISTMGKAQS